LLFFSINANAILLAALSAPIERSINQGMSFTSSLSPCFHGRSFIGSEWLLRTLPYQLQRSLSSSSSSFITTIPHFIITILVLWGNS